MTSKLIQRFRRDEKGNAIVEFAIAAAVIFLLGLGATDFGRLFFDVIVITTAAQTGTQYATLNNLSAAEIGDAKTVAEMALDDPVAARSTVTTSTFCDCPSSPGVGVACTGTYCSGYGLPRMWVQTNIKETFETIVAYPGIPKQTHVDLSSWSRVR